MKQKEAEYIAYKWLFGWASLNTSVNEDFYDYIPAGYLIETKPNNPSIIGDGDHTHEATDEEREQIRKVFERETIRLNKKLIKIREHFKQSNQ